MKEEELRYFEQLCDLLYSPSAGADSQKAGETLTTITGNANFVNDIEFILKNSSNKNALTCVGISLRHAILDNWNSISNDRRYELREMLIQYVRQFGTQVSPLILRNFSTCICVITKMSWLKDKRHRSLLGTIEEIIDSDQSHTVIGLQLMQDFVDQMNQPCSLDNTEHRQIATHFIQENLLDIVQFSMNILNSLQSPDSSITDPSCRLSVLRGVIGVLIKSLQFDFLGSSEEDGSTEGWMIQLPYSWDGVIGGSLQLQGLFDLYLTVEVPDTLQVLELITLVASIRRTFFRDAGQRLEFLQSLLSGIARVLRSGHGISDESTYNMFCQLLSRLKANFQLSELMKSADYAECFGLIAQFTCTSLREWNACSNSIAFLLTLWSRMACANRYVQLTDAMRRNAAVLGSLLPAIVSAYVEGRLGQVCEDGGSASPLGDPEGLQEELTQFPQMVRFEYGVNGGYIEGQMEGLVGEYRRLMQEYRGPSDALSTVENKLALMVHLIGNVVSGQSFMLIQVALKHCEIDARLCRLVLLLNEQVLQNQKSLQYRCSPHLQMAFLAFLQLFRKTFVNDAKAFQILREFDDRQGEAVPPRAVAYRDFFLQVGFASHVDALAKIWGNVCLSLRVWGDQEQVVKESLRLLFDLSSGYEFSKLLLTLDDVTFVLQHHTEQEFPFLANPAFSHLRTRYYQALTNLILLQNQPGRFEVLLQPVAERLHTLAGKASFGGEDYFALVSVFRDCRGVVEACRDRRSFSVFLGLLCDFSLHLMHRYPDVFQVMRHALAERGSEEEIVSSIMKFLGSLVLNKESRIDFCNELANGYTLFKETGQVLQVYGQLLLDTFKSFEQCPPYVYKNVSQLFHVMERFLKGKYVPFGVFEVYRDNALNDVIAMYLQIVVRTPFRLLSQYPKYERAVFVFLELLFMNHLDALSAIDPVSFVTIMESVCNGVSSFNPDVVKYSARILDRVATYLHLNKFKNNNTINNIKRLVTNQANFWNVVLTSVLNAFIFGNANTHWDLSRPIFSIYLVQPNAFEQFMQNACAGQNQMAIAPLVQETRIMLNLVDAAMSERSRDEFSKEAIKWRGQYLACMKL